jgi:AraC-like DNA-binding protein
MAPMQPQSTSSSAWLRGVIQIFATQGVDAQRLFDEAGVDMARLKHPHMRFSADEVSRLWRLAVEWTGQPALALDRQLAARHINFDIAAQAMWPGPDLRSGLQALARYLHLIGDAAEFSLEPELGGAWMVLAHGLDGASPRQRVEFGMLTLLMLCRRVTHRPVRPQAVEFAFPEPQDYHPYRMAFGGPLRFGQPTHRMLLGDEDLALPLPTSPSLFALHEQVIEERLARTGHLRYTWRTSEAIVRRLHLGQPQAAQVARELDLAEATLQQKLHAEGTTFERVLDEVRHEMAARLLAEPAYPLVRVPALLGFPSPALLAEACERWFGMTPAACRHALTGDRAAH